MTPSQSETSEYDGYYFVNSYTDSNRVLHVNSLKGLLPIIDLGATPLAVMFNGKFYSVPEFNRILKLKAFL